MKKVLQVYQPTVYPQGAATYLQKQQNYQQPRLASCLPYLRPRV